MTDLHVHDKAPIYDAQIQKIGQLPEKPDANGQDEIYFTLGNDLYVAQGRALAGIQNLELGDWLTVDGQVGEIVRVDIETTPQERLFRHTLDTASLQLQTTPGNAECDDYFQEALKLSQGWEQALEVGVAATSAGYLGQMGSIAGDAFSTATDRCLTTQDCLKVAQAAAKADNQFFRWQVRAALRKGLQLAQTPEERQLIAQMAHQQRFPLLAHKAEKKG